MRFKIDENLPLTTAQLLNENGHNALSVHDQKLKGISDADLIRIIQDEERVLITLDLDFSDIKTYPPEEFNGIIVLKLPRHDKESVISAIQRLLPLLKQEPIKHRLWIADDKRLRIRGGE